MVRNSFFIALSLAAAVSSAQAAEVHAWSVNQFGGQLAGTNGWSNGFPQDPWGTSQGGRAIALTDWNTGDFDGNGYGSGWAADNWLIRGDDVGQGGIEVLFINTDDDTFGLVLDHDGHDTFYLAGHSAGNSPPPVNGQGSGDGLVFLIKVDGGTATELGRQPKRLSYDWQDFGLRRNGQTLQVTLDGAVVLEAQDNHPLPPGKAGLYSYDNGEEEQSGGGWGDDTTNCYFETVDVYWFDDDGDSVVDDHDNCENTPNPDQADADGDGMGDACDSSTGGDADTDVDTDSDSDTDVDVDVDTDSDADTDTDNEVDTSIPGGRAIENFPDENLIVGCACSGSNRAPSGNGLVPVVGLLALIGLRRRPL